jgi:hypothetical protein
LNLAHLENRQAVVRGFDPRKVMKKREILAEQLNTCEDKLKGLSSYVTELTAMCTKHSTPNKQYDSDLTEATDIIRLYEVEIARIKKEMEPVMKVGTKPDTLLPMTRNLRVAAAVLSSISFVAGALLGSRLKSRKSSKDRQSGN